MGIYDNTVASRSRNLEIQQIGLQGQDDLRVGFGERFSSANKLTFNRYTPYGRDKVFEDEYDKRDKILQGAGLSTEALITTKRLLDRRDSGNYPDLKSDNLGRPILDNKDVIQVVNFQQYLKEIADNDELLMELKNNHPELDIQSDEEIASKVKMDQIELLNQDEDLAERSSFLGKTGYLTGSMVGWLRDPTHVLASLVGLSPVGRAAMLSNFLRVGAAESSIVAALEVVEKPGEIEFRRRTGEEELTTGEALIESGVNIAAAGVIGGSIGAIVGRFVRPPIPPSRTGNNAVTEATQGVVDNVRAEQATGRVFDPEIEQATDLLDEALQVARNAPKDTSYETHMDNYSDARRAMAQGEDMPGVDNSASVVRASDEEVSAPQGSQTAIPENELSVQDRAIGDLRASLEKQDVAVSRTIDGDVSTSSSREFLAQLDSEDAAVRATIDCLG